MNTSIMHAKMNALGHWAQARLASVAGSAARACGCGMGVGKNLSLLLVAGLLLAISFLIYHKPWQNALANQTFNSR